MKYIGKMRRFRNPEFTEEQKKEIYKYYNETDPKDFDLNSLCTKFGKRKQNISRQARRLGLSKQGRKPSQATIRKLNKPKWQDKPHPKGMLEKNLSLEAIKKVSAASKASWLIHKANGTGSMSPENRQRRSDDMSARMALLPPEKSFSRAKYGFREDIGIFVRSSWEANYARYLNLLMKMGVVETWEYESETFWFEAIKRGTRSYKPDFKVKYKNDPIPERVEVKGWVQPKDRTKWARMKKYHPAVRLVVVGAKEYRNIQNKWKSAIPNWE